MLNGMSISLYKNELKYWCIIFLLSFPHAKPGFASHISILDSVYDYLRIISFVIIFICVLSIKRLSITVLLIIFTEGFLVLNTAIKGGAFHRSIVSAASIISVVLLYELAAEECENKYEFKKIFYSSQLAVFEVLIYINLLTEIIWPNGMYIGESGYFIMKKCYFLGYYNNHSMYYIPALMFAWLLADLTGKRLRAIVLTIAIWMSAIIVWSGGVLASLAAMTIFYLIYNKEYLRPLVAYYIFWIIQPLFVIIAIILNSNISLLHIIDILLHKGGSFNLRLLLWSSYLKLISKCPYTGYGIWDQAYREDQVGFYWGMHAHNLILEILYEGGLVYLVLFSLIIIISGRQLRYKSNESRIITIAFLGWIIATLVEPFTGPFLMGMFIILTYSNGYNSSQTEKVRNIFIQ